MTASKIWRERAEVLYSECLARVGNARTEAVLLRYLPADKPYGGPQDIDSDAQLQAFCGELQQLL